MNILDKIGMCCIYRGYKLWLEAVSYFKDKEIYIENIKMDDIYKKIGKKYNLKKSAVEKDMRTAVEKIENINEKFNVDFKITNKKFLILLLQKNGGKIK